MVGGKHCPHCGGKLHSHSSFGNDLECEKCQRGWNKNPDNSWTSADCTDIETIKAKDWKKWSA